MTKQDLLKIQDLACKWLNSSDEHGHNTNKNRVDAYCAGFDRAFIESEKATRVTNEALKLAITALEIYGMTNETFPEYGDVARSVLAEIRKLQATWSEKK